jgi:protein tyrosine/serine phosphatase
MLSGSAPVPVSSGRTDRHRLNRLGDRQLNRALHIIAINRMRSHQPTQAYVLPALQPLLNQFKSIGGDPELLMPVVGVRKEYLETALDEMHKRYKTVDGYFSQGLGLDAVTIGKLRDKLTERR